jgi:hypothetical protein
MKDHVNIDELRAVYADARFHGRDVEAAINAAWLYARAHYLPRARAPYGVEATGPLNTSRRRNYRSPLGEALGVVTSPYGQHSALWQRTVASYREREAVVKVIAVALGEKEVT